MMHRNFHFVLWILAGALLTAIGNMQTAWADPVAVDSVQFERSLRELESRQRQLSSKAIAYLWDTRMDRESGRIGKTQGRFLQALCYLALVADGSDQREEYRERLEKVIASLRQPLAELAENPDSQRKIFVGTSRESLALETHAVIALAYEQLAASDLGNPGENELFSAGAESAIEYLMDFRNRGRDYARAGGWPVNTAPYNRNRPDRRCTAWQLLLLKAHTYNGGKVNSTALTEAPSFVLAAQRLAPPLTDELKAAQTAHAEWAPKMRRGQQPPEDLREPINEYLEYTRQLEESGGFGVDTIGIVTPGATAVGLFTLGSFAADDRQRFSAAAEAYVRMPLAWDAQRFFLTQFFAVRGLHRYSQQYRTLDFHQYMNRVLTLMEQKQESDGSFPLGSSGVEELTQMERVYTTAMCVLIINCNRGNLLFDRAPY